MSDILTRQANDLAKLSRDHFSERLVHGATPVEAIEPDTILAIYHGLSRVQLCRIIDQDRADPRLGRKLQFKVEMIANDHRLHGPAEVASARRLCHDVLPVGVLSVAIEVALCIDWSTVEAGIHFVEEGLAIAQYPRRLRAGTLRRR